MGNLGNFWSATDWQNAQEQWLSTQQYNQRQITFMKFDSYVTQGNASNPDESYRSVKYRIRADHVWLSQVKVFDTVKGGYFTTGDLDVNSSFLIKGFSAAYTLRNGIVIPEYAGDQMIWNGKVWVVADQIEPVQLGGMLAAPTWWRSVLRRTDRSGIGDSPGPA